MLASIIRAGSTAISSSANDSAKGATVSSLQAQYDISQAQKHTVGVTPFDVMCYGALDKRFGGSSGGGDKEVVSVWIWNGSNLSTESDVMHALKRIKTLKHPLVASYIASAVDAHKCIWLVTESALPLSTHLARLDQLLISPSSDSNDDDQACDDLLGSQQSRVDQIRSDYLVWGLYQTFQAVAFLHNDAKLAHNSLSTQSVVVNRAGEWKLFGLQHVAPVTSCPSSTSGSSSPYKSPELKRSTMNSQSVSSDVAATAADCWALGCIVWQVHNADRNLDDARLLSQTAQIPAALRQIYKELVSANPRSRPAVHVKLAEMLAGGYFATDVINALKFVDEIHIKSHAEKVAFFADNLPPLVSRMPPFVQCYKLLSQLITAFHMAMSNRSQPGLQSLLASLVVPILTTAQHLDETSYSKQVVPVVVQMFALSDRNIRFKLLKNVNLYANRVDCKSVNDDIFLHYQQGFVDQESVIRELSIFALVHLASKLSKSNLDDAIIMRHFAPLMRDQQNEAVRTNATVCLAKIARSLHPTTRKRMLIAAFTSRLNDPFGPARMAGINGLASSQSLFSIADTSSILLPALVTRLGDPDKEVRVAAFKNVRCFVDKLEQISKNPDLATDFEADLDVWEKDEGISSQSGAAAAAASLASAKRLSSAASSWTSWAVSSMSAKFYKTDALENFSRTAASPSGSSNSTSVVTSANLTATTNHQSNTGKSNGAKVGNRDGGRHMNRTTKSPPKPLKLANNAIQNPTTCSVDDLVDWTDLDGATDGWDLGSGETCEQSFGNARGETADREDNSRSSNVGLSLSNTTCRPSNVQDSPSLLKPIKLGAMRLGNKSKEEQMIDDLLFS